MTYEAVLPPRPLLRKRKKVSGKGGLKGTAGEFHRPDCAVLLNRWELKGKGGNGGGKKCA